MLRLRRFTSIEDIVSWEIKIPKSEVSLLYKRSPNGHEYFTCGPYLEHKGSPRVYMTPEELFEICNHITNWISEKFKSHNAINQWGEIISGGKETDNKRLTLTFSKRCYENIVDIRIWRRIEDIFVPTSHGFWLTGDVQINYLSHIQKIIERKLKDKSMLEEYINTAHSVLYQQYYTLKSIHGEEKAFYHIVNPKNIDEFTIHFRKQWRETIYFNDGEFRNFDVSNRDLFTYVTNVCVENLKKYITYHDLCYWELCRSMSEHNLETTDDSGY